MQRIAVRQSEPPLTNFVVSNLPDAPHRDSQLAQQACADHQFIAMLDAYRYSGGLAPAQEVVALFRRHSDDGPATLTRLIVDQSVICFGWQSTVWLPLFQFNPPDMSTLPGLGQVLTALNSNFDTWHVANWFAQPNSWLDGATPTDMLGRDPKAVINAACALRASR